MTKIVEEQLLKMAKTMVNDTNYENHNFNNQINNIENSGTLNIGIIYVKIVTQHVITQHSSMLAHICLSTFKHLYLLYNIHILKIQLHFYKLHLNYYFHPYNFSYNFTFFKKSNQSNSNPTIV